MSEYRQYLHIQQLLLLMETKMIILMPSSTTIIKNSRWCLKFI